MEKVRKKLQEEKQKVEREIKSLKEADPFADPERAVDNAASDTEVREEVGHDNIEAQINQLSSTLEQIDKALEKLSKGEYGKCEVCGEPIRKERLEILPYARFCMQCQQKLSS